MFALLIGIVLLALGAYFLFGGYQLMVLGGSLYYLVAGIVLIATAYLLARAGHGGSEEGIRIALAIGGSTALSDYSGKQLLPLANGEELEQFFRDGVGTFWHQSSTARIGRDPMSVVDGRLNVHGVARLRVADASILPRVTTGNTMAPCVVIGEMAAKFMIEGF